MKEIYKDIEGYEGEYQITSNGRVWSIRNQKFLSPNLNGTADKQYYYVSLSKNGSQRNFCIHRLVAFAFLPNPDNLPCVNHKDCNKLNNNIENLEWCTYEYNNNYQDRKTKAIETRKKNGHCIKVALYDKNTQEFKGEFESVRDAIATLGLSKNASANISQVLSGKKKSAYGYFWKKIE